jgi:hypothetical protein
MIASKFANTHGSTSDLEARQTHDSLTLMLEELLRSNQDLRRRLRNLEDAHNIRSTKNSGRRKLTVSSELNDETSIAIQPGTSRHICNLDTPSPSFKFDFVLRFAFDAELESSGVYQKAKRHHSDNTPISVDTKSHKWSAFSGLSLADISHLSEISLPLYSDDIAKHEHYSFGTTNNNEDIVNLCRDCEETLEGVAAFELGKLTTLELHYQADRVTGKHRWHTDCFRCNMCSVQLDSESVLLHLRDKSLICERCNALGIFIVTGHQLQLRLQPTRRLIVDTESITDPTGSPESWHSTCSDPMS